MQKTLFKKKDIIALMYKGKTIQDRKPNFRDEEGNLFLVRCFVCGGDYGTENWAGAVATGQCAFCGWEE